MIAKLLPSLLMCIVAVPLCAQQVAYSFVEARDRMIQHNAALKAAESDVQIARRERQRVRALWWPQLQAEGMYLHLSERVEVREPLSQFTDPAKAYIQSLLPDEQLVTGLLDRVGEYALIFPLLPQNVSSLGLTAEWVAFSGGKRVFADKMSRRLVDVAEVGYERLRAAEQVALVECYYGLVLARQTVEVCRQCYEAMQHHYEDVLRMEEVGMANRAARLVAQVAVEEAEFAWRQAESIEQTRQASLKQLLGIAGEQVEVIPTSPLFEVAELPAKALFVEAMRRNNYTLTTLSLEEQIVKDKLRADLGGYLPEVALLGKHTLCAHGLPSNLLPRTMVGIGFTWNLFDGLDRERTVSQARLTQQTLVWSRQDTEEKLMVAVTELYATLERTMDEIQVLDATIALNEELLRTRRVAFAEGMATSTQLVDAEDALATSRQARLAAQYAYDVALANLLALCGMDCLPQ